MSYVSRLSTILLIATTLLPACTPGNGERQSQAANSSAPSLSLPTPPSVASPSASPTPTPAPTSQNYQEKSGLFTISFPKGYTHKATGSGVAFVSADQGFAGAVDFSSAGGSQLNTQQLEAALKTEFEKRLTEVTWQTSKVQPDGSVRVDWVGKDPSGSTLDALSIIEQRGDTIFVLNLFGVNKPYQNYNSDAEAIVRSYQIRPERSDSAAQENKTQDSKSQNDQPQVNQPNREVDQPQSSDGQ